MTGIDRGARGITDDGDKILIHPNTRGAQPLAGLSLGDIGRDGNVLGLRLEIGHQIAEALHHPFAVCAAQDGLCLPRGNGDGRSRQFQIRAIEHPLGARRGVPGGQEVQLPGNLRTLGLAADQADHPHAVGRHARNAGNRLAREGSRRHLQRTIRQRRTQKSGLRLRVRGGRADRALARSPTFAHCDFVVRVGVEEVRPRSIVILPRDDAKLDGRVRRALTGLILLLHARTAAAIRLLGHVAHTGLVPHLALALGIDPFGAGSFVARKPAQGLGF